MSDQAASNNGQQAQPMFQIADPVSVDFGSGCCCWLALNSINVDVEHGWDSYVCFV